MLATYIFAIAAVVVAGMLLLPIAERANIKTGDSWGRTFLGINWYVGYDLYHWAFPISVDLLGDSVAIRVLFINIYTIPNTNIYNL